MGHGTSFALTQRKSSTRHEDLVFDMSISPVCLAAEADGANTADDADSLAKPFVPNGAATRAWPL
jgi:hypothetical protein